MELFDETDTWDVEMELLDDTDTSDVEAELGVLNKRISVGGLITMCEAFIFDTKMLGSDELHCLIPRTLSVTHAANTSPTGGIETGSSISVLQWLTLVLWSKLNMWQLLAFSTKGFSRIHGSLLKRLKTSTAIQAARRRTGLVSLLIRIK
jgi:hypothetical protein